MRKRFVRNQADILSFIKPPYVNSSTVGLQVMPGLIENHYFEPDAPFAKTHKKLAQTFLGSDVTITSQTADGKELVVLMMSDKNPGDFYLFDNETNSASYLLSRKAWIDPNKMSKRKPI